MTSDLKNKTLNGIQWTFVEAIGWRGIQFLIGIILARMLLPEQFGLIGMLTVFIAVSQTFVDSGFGSALIQNQNITELEKNSIFYFNIFIGACSTGCLFVVAPYIAEFYNQPILILMLRFMSVILLVNSFGLVQNILLRKSLNFKAETKVSILSVLVSGIIGILLAYQGYGVWSLVAQQLSSAIIRTFLLWLSSSWRPSIQFSTLSLLSLFGFSSKVFISNFQRNLFDNIYYVVIGKLFSSVDLGFFTRANTLQKLPSNTLVNVITRVTFPVFSAIHKDIDRVVRGLRKGLRILAFLNFPLMIGLAVVAHPLILVLLTKKWLPCVPYLQILCISGLILPITMSNLSVLLALGRSDLSLGLEIVKNVLVVISISVVWRWGIIALISGQVIITMICYCLSAFYTKKLLNYTIKEQISDLVPYLFCALVMGGIVYLMSYLSTEQFLFLLVGQIAVGASVYVLLCRLFRLKAFMEILNKYSKRLGN